MDLSIHFYELKFITKIFDILMFHRNVNIYICIYLYSYKSIILQKTNGEFKNEFYNYKLSSDNESTLNFAPDML